MERRAMLRPLRKPQDGHGPERQANAVLVLGLPKLFQRSDRHGDGVLQASDPEMGYRHLPLSHQPQERFEHEAPQGHRHFTAGGMVHAPPYP